MRATWSIRIQDLPHHPASLLDYLGIKGKHLWVGRKRVARLMGKMGLVPVYQKPNTSKPHPEHRVYPYLLRGLEISQPGHVWCADMILP